MFWNRIAPTRVCPSLLRGLRVLGIGLGLAIGRQLSGGPSAEKWVEVRTPNFVAYSDSSIREATEYLMKFEEVRLIFRKVFPTIRVDAGTPTFLLVLKDAASMKRFLPHQFEGKLAKRPGGSYWRHGDRNYALLRLDVQETEASIRVLFHEFTHGILQHNFPRLPTWLDEGLADFYGATQIKSKRVFIGSVPPGRLEFLRESPLLSLDTLLAVTHDSPHYKESDKTNQFYAQSWALVHYLLMDEKANKEGYFRFLAESCG